MEVKSGADYDNYGNLCGGREGEERGSGFRKGAGEGDEGIKRKIWRMRMGNGRKRKS